MPRKLTNEEFLQKLKDLNIRYTPLEEYKGSTTKIKWQCYEDKKHIFEKTPNQIFNGIGCPHCPRNKQVIGETDLWTTHPEIAKMLKYPEDGYKYSYGSGQELLWICPRCGTDVLMAVYKVVSKGLCCRNCSDGISYPEKFMSSILTQLNVVFEREKSFNWSKNKRYDFYLEKYNTIIECHGAQHYEQSFTCIGARSLEEEKENDILKKRLAIKNGIDTYIVINCSKSKKGYIKNSVIDSEMNNMFNLSLVNWHKCDMAANNSYFFDVLNLWNSGNRNTSHIADILKISTTSVVKALHKLTDDGLCLYNPKQSFFDNAIKTRFRKIVCLETGKVYESIKSVVEDGFNKSGVSMCLTDRAKTSGGCHWCYFEEYDENAYVEPIVKRNKVVVCVETGAIYQSITETSKQTNIYRNQISGCCEHKQGFNTAGGYHWMYYDNYLKQIKE